MTEIHVTTRSELLTALSSSTGGETIVLAPGAYGSIDIRTQFAETVTIRAEAPLQAELTAIKMVGASNLRVDGVHVQSGVNGGDGGRIVDITNCTNIEIVNCEVNGRIDDVYLGHNGIHVKDGSNIVIQNNYVHNVNNGIVGHGPQDFEVSGNRIDYVAADHMKFSWIDRGVIEGNFGGGNTFPPPGGHPDFMQFEGNSRHVEIRDNVLMSSNVAHVQGIFLNNGTYSDILIEGNIINTGAWRGITVAAGEGIVVRENTLLNMPGLNHHGTKIDVPAGSVVSDNIMTSYRGGYDAGRNTLILQNVDPERPFYVEDYLLNGTKGRDLTLGDLEIVEGIAEITGAFRLLMQLSSVGLDEEGNFIFLPTEEDGVGEDPSGDYPEVPEDGETAPDASGILADPVYQTPLAEVTSGQLLPEDGIALEVEADLLL